MSWCFLPPYFYFCSQHYIIFLLSWTHLFEFIESSANKCFVYLENIDIFIWWTTTLLVNLIDIKWHIKESSYCKIYKIYWRPLIVTLWHRIDWKGRACVWHVYFKKNQIAYSQFYIFIWRKEEDYFRTYLWQQGNCFNANV